MAVKVRDSLELITTIKYTNAVANTLNIYMICGLIEYASETGVAWTAGDKIYWDDTNKRFTKTTTSNTLAGIVYEDKASASATGMVLLWPGA